MGIIERKEKKKGELQKMILDASMKLFIEEGFEKVTIRKIADIIEYSPTTIYLYFKDKNEILFDLCQQGFIKMAFLNLELNTISNPLERLQKMGENYIRFGLENQEYYDLMFIQEAPIEKLHAMNNGKFDNVDAILELLRSIVKECMDKNLITRDDVDSVAMAFWGMVHGLVSLAIRKRFSKLVETEKVVKSMHQAMTWMINSVDNSKK